MKGRGVAPPPPLSSNQLNAGGERFFIYYMLLTSPTSNQLERVWVLLLRHQAASSAVSVGEQDKSKFLGAVHGQILCPLRQVNHRHRTPAQELSDEIPSADCIQRVAGRGREA